VAREHGTPVVMFAGSVRRWDGPELPLFHEVVELVAQASPGTLAAKVLCETAALWAATRLKGR